MSGRKKDKVKSARARETERLRRKAAAAFEDDSVQPALKDDEPAARRKDSKGKKIPTESERRTKGEIKPDVKRRSTRPTHRKTTPKEVLWAIAAHPFLILLSIVLIVMLGAFVFDVMEEDRKTSAPAEEDSKTMSLIGMTTPARAVLADTGKFDGLWIDEDSGVEYARLFDRNVTAEEQKILDARKQGIGDDYLFAYNEDISSAKLAKDAAAENGASQQAGTDTEELSDDAGEAENKSIFD